MEAVLLGYQGRDKYGFLHELRVGVHTLTRTSGVDSVTEAPWPKSACQSDIVNFTGTFDSSLGQTFPSPDDIREPQIA